MGFKERFWTILSRVELLELGGRLNTVEVRQGWSVGGYAGIMPDSYLA